MTSSVCQHLILCHIKPDLGPADWEEFWVLLLLISAGPGPLLSLPTSYRTLESFICYWYRGRPRVTHSTFHCQLITFCLWSFPICQSSLALNFSIFIVMFTSISQMPETSLMHVKFLSPESHFRSPSVKVSAIAQWTSAGTVFQLLWVLESSLPVGWHII